jgi:hypothetical protein
MRMRRVASGVAVAALCAGLSTQPAARQPADTAAAVAAGAAMAKGPPRVEINA